MSDARQLSLELPAHRNHGLFADHYLDHVLPGRAEWARLAEEAAPVLDAVRALFAAYVPSTDEQQTEQELVRPVLDVLGHTYEVQGRLRVPGRIHKPDYVLYRDTEAKNANKNVTLDNTLPSRGGMAVGDAKYWGRSLDTAQGGVGEDNRNPAFQIYWYVLHSGVDWGLLTNGKLWRLVHRDTADRLDVYYEVDLQELAQTGDPARFLYFYAFFRRAAFDPGPLGLAELLRASTDYAHAVSDSLKAQVYDALRHIAQGFLDYTPNGLQPDAETLKSIYDNALILLYRLIFILYAEARELLPVRANVRYRDRYSLYAVKREAARGADVLPDSEAYWSRLKYLFRAINEGNPPLSIATFNGGLFDPRKYPFLEQYAVGDAHLQQAIDMLARVDGQFIDYRDLAVRHMGTIYEGLLEYHLQSLAIPEPGWTVELVNDRGERKATGSYYTPDYVVKFIVERAIGPALREAVADTATDADRLRVVLEVNVLDPAMGSGHFLVEATEYLARFLVDQGIAPEGKTPEEADLAYWKRRVAQSCIYGVDLNPLAVELAKLSLWLTTVAKDRPLSFLDHHLRPGNSLVGARLEHLRPRAAKQARSRRKAEQAAANGQFSLFDSSAFTQRLKLAVDNMWLIEHSEALEISDVKRQEEMYATLREHFVARYARLLHLSAAAAFGLAVEPAHWPTLITYASNGNGATFPAFEALLREAEAIAARERFFHWELEFPEVYFDRFGRPLGDEGGFEVVIGNPPYVRQEQLAPYKPFFQEEYPEVYHGVADLFVYFFEQGLRQTMRGGRLAYISSDSWLRANYATPLRKHLRETTTVDLLVDLGDNHVFKEAPDVYPAIHLVRKAAPPEAHTAQAAVFTRGEGVQPFETRVDEKFFPVAIHDQPDSGWQLSGDESRRLFAKLMAGGTPLGELVEGRMFRGVLTGLNDAFIIDQATRDRLVADDPACAALLKKMLRGEDLRPWYQEDEGRWLIVLPNGWTRQTFGDGLSEDAAWTALSTRHPSLTTYLTPFADAARKRWDKGEYWWELRPCDYYQAFDPPKIMWPDLSNLPRFSWDESELYINNKGYIIPNADPFLLGALQSRVMWFAISQICLPIGERAGLQRYQLFTQYTAKLPIPAASSAERDALGALAMEITGHARARYALHAKVRRRIRDDLGTRAQSLNGKLAAWWALDFPALRAEVKKVFARDIPLAERDDWDAYLAAARAEHARLTAEIVRLETALNARVYALFHLTGGEIARIEASTKYRYGEV